MFENISFENIHFLEDAERLSTFAQSADEQKHILTQLIHAEVFEHFLHTKFVGQKRFSLEGAETLIPMLAAIIEQASLQGIDEVVLGMSHRGRLNVLAHIFQKPLSEIIAEFKDLDYTQAESSGDVKYHKGHAAELTLAQERSMLLTMISNPSHLESVDPVALGFTRARIDHKGAKLLSILIHGDAAIAGQGVVYETLQLSKLEGYTVGGTIHIVLDNHIGFTTHPKDSRSTKECTDIAKAFSYPVFKVQAEQPEECVVAATHALSYKLQKQEDIFIHLDCYRKYGHNESDEPAFTQPVLYSEIRSKKSIATLYAEKLGVPKEPIAAAYLERLQNAHEQASPSEGAAKEVKVIQQSDLSVDALVELGKKLSTLPSDIQAHERIKKMLAERKEQLINEQEDYVVDWAFAESLALASLLEQGINIRLVGQDTRRGTFSQRHAVIVDQKSEREYVPLQNLGKQQASFQVYDSPLSEYAALGFEYGYSISINDTLVLWEAQFGDFVNNAEVIIDQYIAAGESKWGALSNLTLLLPHGYEGQGPEHSSGRMERFLQLASEENMYIVNPTTPAQYYHILRKQALRQKPLILFTPKGLLRNSVCTSTLSDLAYGSFQEVLEEKSAPQDVKKLIFCQGKVYYDIKDHVPKDATILRIEQLYPNKQLDALVKKYKQVTAYIFVQEEPKNAGAYTFLKETIEPLLPASAKLQYIGRPASASPATGSHEMHVKQHEKIIEELQKL